MAEQGLQASLLRVTGEEKCFLASNSADLSGHRSQKLPLRFYGRLPVNVAMRSPELR